ACGVPVVGSDAGGIPEAVGEGGLIVEEGDEFEERFAEAVCTVLHNPPSPEKLRKRAQEYDWEKTVQKEVEVYRGLLR
ncbi:MAG: glycosyltransferase, partial [Candidatus Methanoculleus thermohydrogenotrophicum]